MRDPYSVERVDPTGLSLTVLKACVATTAAGGAVEEQFPHSQMSMATELVVATTKRQIVGVGAIKANTQERWDNAARVAKKACHAIDSKTLELAYETVDTAHCSRKLAHRPVTSLLTNYLGPLFASTSIAAMKWMLGHAGFKRADDEWLGDARHYWRSSFASNTYNQSSEAH